MEAEEVIVPGEGLKEVTVTPNHNGNISEAEKMWKMGATQRKLRNCTWQWLNPSV